jgi:hypothetical protein
VLAALPAIGVAAAIGAVCLAYPAWYAVDGPQHILGRSQQAVEGIRLINVFLPSTHDLVAGRWPGSTAFAFNQQGDMAFLGIPLLAILAAVIVWQRRSRLVQFATVFGLASWVLSLGPTLQWHGRLTKIRLPFDVLDHLPLFQDLVPSRLMLFADLAAGIILAVGVDALMGWSRARSGEHGSASGANWASRLAGVVVGVVGVIFILPVSSTTVVSTGVAKYFADGKVDSHIPVDGVVLAYPYPMAPDAEAMVWAASDGLRFNLLGGYALRPYKLPQYNKQPAMLEPKAVQDVLLSSWPAALPGSSRKVTVRAAERALPTFVRKYDVTTLVVDQAGRRPQRVVRMFSAVYGRPYRLGSLLIWSLRR